MELSEGPNEKADAKEKHRKEKKKNEEEKKNIWTDQLGQNGLVRHRGALKL